MKTKQKGLNCKQVETLRELVSIANRTQLIGIISLCKTHLRAEYQLLKGAEE